MTGSAHVLDHPLAQSFLTDIRCRYSSRTIVRNRIRALSVPLFYEATRDLPQQSVPVTTPLADTHGAHVSATVGLVPILQAGLGMVDDILEFLPEARVFHLGLFRDEKTLQPVEYDSKLHEHQPVDIAFVLDPMLAASGSAVVAVTRLKEWGVKSIRYLSLLAAPEGIAELAGAHPDVPIHLVAVDSECLLALHDLRETFGRPHLHAGLSIRKLRAKTFECRANLRLRYLFANRPECLSVFALASYDEGQRLLRSGTLD